MPPTLCGAVISDLEPDSCALSDPSVLSTECDDLYLNVGNHNFIQVRRKGRWSVNPGVSMSVFGKSHSALYSFFFIP